MRRLGIFVLLALSLIFKGSYAWWAAAARGIEPIILSFGAAFAALGLNDNSSLDLQLFKRKVWSKNEFENENMVSKDRTAPINKYPKIMKESKKIVDPILD